jgi:azurin
MRRFWVPLLIAPLLAAWSATPIAQQAPAKATPRTIDIQGTDQMKFSVPTINAKPGEALRVRLIVVSTLPKVAMSHNFVLFSTKATEKHLADFAQAGMTKGQVTYIPPAMKDLVLAFTPMGGGGQTVEVTFNAPKQPGSYPYICSFIGHFAVGMRGTLIVK